MFYHTKSSKWKSAFMSVCNVEYSNGVFEIQILSLNFVSEVK